MTILQKNSPELRKTAQTVPVVDIKTKKIQDIVRDMKDALASQDDGVAIAAPQIGVTLRIFVVSKKVFEMTKKYAHIENDLVFINPKIIKISKKKKEMEEGCLSVRWLYGKVERSMQATVEAHNEHGEKFTMGGSGLLAQIFQHETDHLDGILFIDKAHDLEEIPPEER